MKKNNEFPLEDLARAYSEFGLHNADKFAPFLYAASTGNPNDANVMLAKLDALWTPIAMLHTYVALTTLHSPTPLIPPTPPTHLEKPLLKSITLSADISFISYGNIIKELGINVPNIANLDDNAYFIEGMMYEVKTDSYWVILEDMTSENPADLEPAPEIGEDYFKLNRRYTDHLTLMAVSQMAFAIILNLTNYHI